MSVVPRSVNVELLANTTHKLIRPFGAVVRLPQATNLFASTLNDRYHAHGARVVLALGFVQLAFAALLLRSRGPLYPRAACTRCPLRCTPRSRHLA